jgi:hypothetical protein
MEALPEVTTYRDPLCDPLPDDPRQYPHPESDEWNDPEWRAEWLAGLTDAELKAMSPSKKGQTLKSYCYNSGYETFGIRAEHFSVACDLFNRAGVPHLVSAQMFAIGAELLKGNYGNTSL